MYIVIIKFNRLNYFRKKRANWIFYASSCLVIDHISIFYHGIRFVHLSFIFVRRNELSLLVVVVKFVRRRGAGREKSVFIRGRIHHASYIDSIRGIER